ncbi:MAG: hypothetical protein DME18_03695 [Verrucomicrobia bacterium]|nr:MAG: hypothetical protein DME19_19575 [Verrucomicrobiota bacterium]PYM15672.1 MAG: hypothetical protein DME18_03695 [Verrucomicrobiota bacterium]
MHRQNVGARAVHRQQEGERIRNSASLAQKFPELKALTVNLAYYNSDRVTKSTQFKYTVNLNNARSVFCFDCLNKECVRGDFDLSEELTNAVAAHRTTAAGEMSCQGWLSKDTIDTVHCHNILRYKLSLDYK